MQPVDIRHQAVSPAILAKIIKKLNLKTQVYLSMTSHFGKEAIEAYGIPVAYVDCSSFSSQSAWIKRLDPQGNALLSCWGNTRRCYDQLFKINGKDTVDFELETRHRVFRGGMKIDPQNVKVLALARIPRPMDIETIEIEFDVQPVGPVFGWEQYCVRIGFIMTGPLTNPRNHEPFAEKYHVVVEIMRNRAADRAGLRMGDRVYKINDQELSLDCAETLKLMGSSPRLRVLVKRIKPLELFG